MKHVSGKRLVGTLAILYLIVLVAMWGAIYFDAGSWWPVTLFLFSPRWVLALPLLVLVPLTLITWLRMTAVYLIHGLIILFAILGYRVCWTSEGNSPHQQVLRVLTCNLGGGNVNSDQLVKLASSHNIHVLVLQECPPSVSVPVFQQLGWAHRQEANVAIGSSFALGELQVLARRSSAHYNAVVALACSLRMPSASLASHTGDSDLRASRTVQVVNVHLPTFREALAKARRFAWDGGTEFAKVTSQYRDSVEYLQRQIRTLDGPLVIAGDFNAPVESAYLRDYWSDYRNAFSQVGTGFGYTKYTRVHGIRIDHVLVDSHWTIESARVKDGLGGDHRPVLVELALNR